MHCTINDFFKFSNLKDLLFGGNIVLYKEKEHSTFDGVIEVNMEYVMSLLDNFFWYTKPIRSLFRPVIFLKYYKQFENLCFC